MSSARDLVSRANAKQDASREFIRLAPLIAPRRSSTSVQLPSIEESGLQDLLKAGRGVYPPPAAPSEEDPEDTVFFLNGRKLSRYTISDAEGEKSYIMQAPLENEGTAVFSRTTVGRRNIQYVLEVAQPPKQARACGNGTKSSADRRPVDPPPVIKLRILADGVDVTGAYEANFMLYASLEFARPIANGNIYATNHCPVLTGHPVAGAAYLTKPCSAAYFIFPDISVRHEGYYRLNFHLFEQLKNQNDYDPVQPTPGDRSYDNMINRTHVYTPPFQVFSAKKFPGLESSTKLSQDLADQGCRVRIRKEIRQRKSGAKAGKEKDDHPPLRANSNDRLNSMDSQDPWNRQVAQIEARRPSVDSTISQGYQPSRHTSWAQSSLPSPSSAGPSTAHALHNSYDTAPASSRSWVAEPEEIQSAYRSTYHSQQQQQHQHQQQQQPQHPMPPPLQRRDYPQISPAQPGSDTTTISNHQGLPPISSFVTEIQPNTPRHPEGKYYSQVSSPVAKKRSLGRSSEPYGPSSLKDRARPSPSPKLSSRTGLPHSRYNFNPNSRTPLVGGDQLIEADVESDEGGDPNAKESDDDSITDQTEYYKRADGSRTRMPSNPTPR